MKSWKKRLNEEFDKAAPALNDEVLNAPIVTARPVTTTRATQPTRRKGGWFACVMAVALAAIFVTLGVLGVFNVAPKADKFVFVLDINPSVSFVTDAEGTVLGVQAQNADADVIISSQQILDKITGQPLSEAIVAYTDYAVQLGYLPANARSAVRLSTSDETDDKLLQNVSSSLSSYFKKNGIYAAVVEDKLTTSELCVRLSVDETSLSELSSTLETVSTFFAERSVGDGTTKDEFEKLHDDYIVCDQLLECVKGELVKKLSDIKNFLTQIYLLGQIHWYNVWIMADLNNPERSWFVGADYWTIKEGMNEGQYANLDIDFAELISTMDKLIAEYEEIFGKLESYDFFESLYESMEKLIDSLSNIDSTKLEELSLSAIEESFGQYVEILSCVGVDVSGLETLIAVPTTPEEYVKQLRVSWEQVEQDKLESNKFVYETSREPISDADYDAFIAEIVSKYGSLEKFWQNN